jgi:hypothetical protein
MALIHEPRCPICGSELPVKVLWKFARMEDTRVLPGLSFLNRSGLLRGKIGIACPGCRNKLKIVQTRIRIFRFLAWGLAAACAGWFGEWSRQVHLSLDRSVLYGGIIFAVFVLMSLQTVLTPYLAEARLAGDEEDQLSYPLKSAYEGPSESEN